MFIPFTIEGNNYMRQLITNSEGFLVHLTDFGTVWKHNYTSNNLFDIFKKYNSVVDLENDEILEEFSKCFDPNEIIEISINKINKDIELVFLRNKTSTNISFKVEFRLDLQISNEVSKELVSPMVHTIVYLEEQQKMFLDLIRKKDRELEEYRLEKGEITRNDLKTEKFEGFDKKNCNEKLLLGIFNKSSPFWETFTNRFGEVESVVEPVTVEPWNQVKRKRKVYSHKTVSNKKFLKKEINE